ncbi:MAG: Glutathione S-transferase [Phenylobacterium sp.]|nr:Glutathione S-transferase [Phenylobacterium sp.]
MKLYYDPISTVSRPVMMFAAEHGIALDFEHVDLMTHQNREAAYAAGFVAAIQAQARIPA